MRVKLLFNTPNPEKLVAAAAKLCYSSSNIDDLLENLNDEKVNFFIEMLMSLGHESPLEHINFTFAIEDVSRSLLTQLTRHRIASYSVQSQRYVKIEKSEFVIPPAIKNNSEALTEFLNIMEKCKESYDKLTKILKSEYDKENINDKKHEKASIEDARYVLPNAWCTKIICTFNARSLLNFFNHRCCNRAQWEIRNLSVEMLKEVKKVAPNVFKNAGPVCVKGICSEGKMSCGKAKEMKNFFKNIDLSEMTD